LFLVADVVSWDFFGHYTGTDTHSTLNCVKEVYAALSIGAVLYACNSVSALHFPVVPAKLTKLSPDQNVHEGSPLQLVCEATGKPTPNIT